MEKHHGISIHARTSKRKLQQLGLRRRGGNIDEATVRFYVEHEMQGAGELVGLLGYRHIWHALRLRHHLTVPRQLVHDIMKEIDPEEVVREKARRLERRKYISLEPNFAWSIDGKCN